MENDLMLQKKYTQLYQVSREAIEHIDSGLAEDVLREIKRSPYFSNLEKSNPEIAKKIDDLKIKMQIVNFLAISDDEATNIIKGHLLDFFRIDIPLQERVEARYNYQGHSELNRIRLILKKAILENEELLGNLSINVWINKLEQYKDGLAKTENSIMRFILEDTDARSLPEIEKSVLKSILFVYKKFISTKLIDIFDAVAAIQDESDEKNMEIDYPEVESNFKSAPQKKESLISLTLNEAIKKYPESGEQLITSQKIELKNFHEPVRPSIKNWLQDYVYLLGYENHDAIERGNYLFHTTNTRHLSDSDREKLSYILKAFDEKFPVDVDKERQQIIFNFPQKDKNPSVLRTSLPAGRQVPFEGRENLDQKNYKNPSVPPSEASPLKTPTAISRAYESYSIKKAEPSQQPSAASQKLSAGKIFSESDNNSNIQETKFDFPQRMPFEKEKEESASSEDMHNPEPLSPYRISSSATRDTTVKSQPPIHPNNVIDLKNPKP